MPQQLFVVHHPGSAQHETYGKGTDSKEGSGFVLHLWAVDVPGLQTGCVPQCGISIGRMDRVPGVSHAFVADVSCVLLGSRLETASKSYMRVS